MNGTTDPAALAARLAEIREYLAQLEGDRRRRRYTYQTHLSTLLAAYDALVHERDELRRLLDDTAKADELVQERDAATVRFDALAEAVDKVLAGFEAGTFVRNVSADSAPWWALKVAPYLAALARLDALARAGRGTG